MTTAPDKKDEQPAEKTETKQETTKTVEKTETPAPEADQKSEK